MRKKAALLLVLAAACGSPLNATFKGTSPQPVSLTLQCAATAADSLGYKVQSADHANTMTAIRKDSAVAPYEDGRQEKLTAVGKDAKDGSSSFAVSGATYSLKWTRIGLEIQEIPASERVKGDAKTLAARCGGAVG
jgi:hypothetical protein